MCVYVYNSLKVLEKESWEKLEFLEFCLKAFSSGFTTNRNPTRFTPTSEGGLRQKSGVGGAGSAPPYRQQKTPVRLALGQKRDPVLLPPTNRGPRPKRTPPEAAQLQISLGSRRRLTPSDVRAPSTRPE